VPKIYRKVAENYKKNTEKLQKVAENYSKITQKVAEKYKKIQKS
jgi:predicted ATP-grasp superfamily ATP-dependent carboligase